MWRIPLPEPSPIVVLGASGTIGSHRCTNLIARGLPVRAVWRSRPVQISGVESAKADVASGEGLNEALRGAQSLFLLTGDMPEQTQAELRIVEAAAKAGVAHIVKLSTWGAETEGFSIARIHRPVERAIEASGLAHTFLRPNCFMQNFVTYYLTTLRDFGVLRLPCDEDRISFIDARDIATVAAATLASPAQHQNEAYALSGPRALTFGKAVAVLAQATGKQFRYECVSEADFHTDMERFGLPLSYTREVIELCASYRRGESEPVTSIVSDITGHPAIPFSGFARDHAAMLR